MQRNIPDTVKSYWQNCIARGEKPKTVWVAYAIEGGRQPIGYPLGWSTNRLAVKREMEKRTTDPCNIVRVSGSQAFTKGTKEMARKSDTITMGRVFFVRSLKQNGWYYQIDLAPPVGPFFTKAEASAAALARKTPRE